MKKLGRRQSAQISMIAVLFLCVLYGMRFPILYGMFSVDRNLVLFSTELIWYKTFRCKSYWVKYFAINHPNFAALSLHLLSLTAVCYRHCVCSIARSAHGTSCVQRASVCVKCRCALVSRVSVGYSQLATCLLFIFKHPSLLAGSGEN